MSEEELLESMGRIKKSELSYSGIGKYNNDYQARIYSINMLKENYSIEANPDIVKKYNKLDDIIITENLEYLYIN